MLMRARICMVSVLSESVSFGEVGADRDVSTWQHAEPARPPRLLARARAPGRASRRRARARRGAGARWPADRWARRPDRGVRSGGAGLPRRGAGDGARPAVGDVV